MTDAIRAVYERYGFEPVETPAIEYTDALGKFLPDQDRPNEGVFSFQDDDEQWLSLRYDLTAPLARYVAENFQKVRAALSQLSLRLGVFRNEKPGPGRFRQFMQFDADTVGGASMAADAEICMMAADTMEALGIERGQYVVKVNNRKVLDGVLDAIGLEGEANAGAPSHGVARNRQARSARRRRREAVARCRAARTRAGTSPAGAGLNDAAIDRVLAFVGSKGANAESDARQSREGRHRLRPWRPKASTSFGRFLRSRSRGLTARRSHPDRSIRGARPRVLHRPGLRS